MEEVPGGSLLTAGQAVHSKHRVSQALPRASRCSRFKAHGALAGVTQWTECRPVNQRVMGLIPSQGTCLGCGPGQARSRGHERGNYSLMFLFLFPSFPFPSL